MLLFSDRSSACIFRQRSNDGQRTEHARARVTREACYKEGVRCWEPLVLRAHRPVVLSVPLREIGQ